MVWIFIWILRIPFEWLGLDSNASNPFRMVKIWIRMLRIGIQVLWMPVEWLDFAFESFESLSNGSNLHLNASNPFRMVRIWIRMIRITRICIRMVWMPFQWLEFVFKSLKSFESLSNASNPFQMVRIWIRMLSIGIRMLWIPFELMLKFAFYCFESRLKGLNLHSYVSNFVRMVRIFIRIIQIPFRIGFECFESLSNG